MSYLVVFCLYKLKSSARMHVAEKTVFIALATILANFKISKARDAATGAEITPDSKPLRRLHKSLPHLDSSLCFHRSASLV